MTWFNFENNIFISGICVDLIIYQNVILYNDIYMYTHTLTHESKIMILKIVVIKQKISNMCSNTVGSPVHIRAIRKMLQKNVILGKFF